MATSTMGDLKAAIEENLETSGKLGSIRALLRAEVFHLMTESEGQGTALSDENLFINELIREYLAFNGYNSTLSVMLPETGQPREPVIDREILAQELNLEEDSNMKKVPLIYSVVNALKNSRTASRRTPFDGVNQPVESFTVSHSPQHSTQDKETRIGVEDPYEDSFDGDASEEEIPESDELTQPGGIVFDN